ncbi:peptide-methionine (R)-S-oxide reductase MsrB [Flagellimonas sp. DF-77]|uniref:peptide-methionine (R)-S-oxide reductase MsrB n=1 Tax=Flagellimonas algarum TaxID=3230298 RepID=UPI00339186BD
MSKNKKYNVAKSEAEWKKDLSPESYYILRQKGTERPFTGKYNLHFEEGAYHCKACNAKLFESNNKFESGCGWPSFDQAIEGAIEYIRDTSHGMIRTETVCANCGGHLGHVFNDGPKETTGQRYCINSGSIDFESGTE